MGKENDIRNIEKVYTILNKRSGSSSWGAAVGFPKGGQSKKCFEKFIDEFVKLCGGEMNYIRLVDYCVYHSYRLRESPKANIWKPTTCFSKKAIDKFIQSQKGCRYYEDNWLKEKNITRSQLVNLIYHRENHPQSKYIYMPSEEYTKRRFLNTKEGFMLCQTATLGWSPLSESCYQCESVEDCKANTSARLPELYRIRTEYGKGN